MTTSGNLHRIFVFALITLLAGNILYAQVTRPIKQTDNVAIDNFVNECFVLYNKTTMLSTNVNGIQKQLLTSSGMDYKLLMDQLNECGSGLQSLESIGKNLISSSSNMVEDAKKISPFKMIRAAINVKAAIEAATYSVKNITVMLTSTIPSIKQKITGDKQNSKAINSTGQ